MKLDDVRVGGFDAIFYPGGHGPMWDLVDNPNSIALIEIFYNAGKPVAAVCHAPGVLHRVTYEGAPIVKGKRVTGFTNGEEEAVQLTNVVPFLVEDELKRLGGLFEKAPNWQSFAITDGRLVTGQNPASSTAGAQALLKLLAATQPARGPRTPRNCCAVRKFRRDGGRGRPHARAYARVGDRRPQWTRRQAQCRLGSPGGRRPTGVSRSTTRRSTSWARKWSGSSRGSSTPSRPTSRSGSWSSTARSTATS